MDSAVEVLEEQYTRPDSVKPSIAFVFRKVLEENNEKAIDKCKTHKHSEYMCIEERWMTIDRFHMFCCSECDGRTASQSFCLLQTGYRPFPPAAGHRQSRGRQVHAGCEYECVSVVLSCGWQWSTDELHFINIGRKLTSVHSDA